MAFDDTLRVLLDSTYPRDWQQDWLRLPIPGYAFHFHVVEAAYRRSPESGGIPTSEAPELFVKWEHESDGFFVCTREKDPLIRDRFVLVPFDEFGHCVSPGLKENHIVNACLFALETGRVVWHNPRNGGARSLTSCHFQSLPRLTQANAEVFYTIPCIGMGNNHPGSSLQIEVFGPDRYPINGIKITGAPKAVGQCVWMVVEGYCRDSCNLVLSPQSASSQVVCAHVFPRRRKRDCHVSLENLSLEDADVLTNTPDGRPCPWPFAAIEMGLLSQVIWPPVFDSMRANPDRWGELMCKIAQRLSLNRSEEDWASFHETVQVTQNRIE